MCTISLCYQELLFHWCEYLYRHLLIITIIVTSQVISSKAKISNCFSQLVTSVHLCLCCCLWFNSLSLVQYSAYKMLLYSNNQGKKNQICIESSALFAHQMSHLGNSTQSHSLYFWAWCRHFQVSYKPLSLSGHAEENMQANKYVKTLSQNNTGGSNGIFFSKPSEN